MHGFVAQSRNPYYHFVQSDFDTSGDPGKFLQKACRAFRIGYFGQARQANHEVSFHDR